MSDSNIFNQEEEQKASQAIEDNRDRSSDVSNAAQKSPQTPQSGPVEKEKPVKDQLKEDIAHRMPYTTGPLIQMHDFGVYLPTSRHNRSLNRVSRRLRRSERERNRTAKSDISCRQQNEKNNGLSDVSSRDKFGEASFRAEPRHSPESDITPTPFLHNTVTIVEVYELLLASRAKILARFRAKLKKERTI
ncbi:uncharacterized protein EAF02_005097 [Botrytis sinoallii]|uniref:uncharacterized protein n=1 Tax=Botrytis sinoallii TaxID=1463999 RepID=UPI0019019698|nr:uncharacterized protein EAF02_005097 [Botrytis sinoallii]KAF7884761.1 hypothetical protein EAF02_005097 [Botrytis sinoallii]